MPDSGLYYHRVPEDWRRRDKLAWLAQANDMDGVPWQTLMPDRNHTWLNEGLRDDFARFVPMGTKEGKAIKGTAEPQTIFKIYSSGVKTNRDEWVYDFNFDRLTRKSGEFVENYNSEVDRWKRLKDKSISLDEFVGNDSHKLKWSEGIKNRLIRQAHILFDKSRVQRAIYRPYCTQWLYFDRTLVERVYQQLECFPTRASQRENLMICVAGPGNRQSFGCLAVDSPPSVDLAFEKAQCFPFYVYDEDGSNRRENITDWALREFRRQVSDSFKESDTSASALTKRDLFQYVYAILHHPLYRTRYAENLKRELPRVPFPGSLSLEGEGRGEGANASLRRLIQIGAELAHLHLTYEQAAPYPLKEIINDAAPFSWRVERMKLSKDKVALVVNDSITLTGIPAVAFDYRLGNRSALEWVIDQYQVSTDKRSGIVTDPNREDDPEYIVRLVKQVVTVSVETIKRVKELARLVTGFGDTSLE